MSGHGMIVRTEREPGGRWTATAYLVSEGLAGAAVAGRDLPDAAAAAAIRAVGARASNSVTADTEAGAATEAVRLLVVRGL